MTLRRLGGLDAAFIAAETPSNHMHMMAILMLDPSTVPGGYTFEKIKDFVASRLHLVPPLRRRLLEVPLGLARPLWVEEEEIDCDWHVRRVQVRQPGGARELATLAEEMNGRQLDRAAPLWEMAVVEGLESGSIALLAKIHHSLMDGMAGMQFMIAFIGTTPEASGVNTLLDDDKKAARVPTEVELLVGAMPKVVERPLRIAQLGGKSVVSALREWAAPSASEEALPEAHAVARTLFNGRVTPRRSAAFESLPMADVRAVSAAFGVTVNDVVLAVVAGALRAHLATLGELTDEPMVAGVPISTHAPGDDDRTNAYKVMFTSLATQMTDPVDRLMEIHRCSEIEKTRKSAFWGESLSELTEIPSPLFLALVSRAYAAFGLADYLTPFCNLVVSNVPGPPIEMYFAGAKIEGVHPLGPVFDGIGLNITVISFAEAMNVGLSGCSDIVPDLWGIAHGLSEALAKLAAAIPRESESTSSSMQ